MIFAIPKLRQHVWISAFHTTPENVDQLFQLLPEKHPNIGVQLVDLDKVPGRRYLTLATINAAMSFHSSDRIAKSLGMEILLYVAGQKQINVALKSVGVTPRTRRTVAIVAGESSDEVQSVSRFLEKEFGKESNDEIMDDWPVSRVENIRSDYNIGDAEMKAVTGKGESHKSVIERLAVERSALLAAKK